MNNTYSIIYNTALGEYQVASEKTKTRRSKARKLVTVALLGALLTPALAQTPPFNISNTDPAVIASTNNWADYVFQTTAIDDQFFPIYSSVVGSEDNWGTRLTAYVNDPTNQTKKTAFDTANNTLQTNVTNYFTAGNGYLKVNADKTFSIPSSTASNYSAMIIGSSNPAQSNDSLPNQLVAISATDGAKLIYKSTEQDLTEYTGHLFDVRSTGTLIMNTEGNSSIEFNGFRANRDGGVIYNSGNVYLGSNATFSNNSSTYGGAILNNTGYVYLGSDATFSNNFSVYGGAIYNEFGGNVYIGSNATFRDNISSHEAGAISNWGRLNIDTGIKGETTLFTGNLENGKANSIGMGNGILNITGDGTLDMRDPFSYTNYHTINTPLINKSGTSTWKLGGESLGGANASVRRITLNIDAGTLYLYKAGEEDNSHINTDSTKNTYRKVGAGSIKDLSVMKLSSDAKLIAGGGNELTGTTLNIHAGSTLGFKVVDDNKTNPVMTWGFNTVNLVGADPMNVDILSTPKSIGQYHLLSSANDKKINNTVLKYFGFDVSTLDRVKGTMALDTSNVNNIYLNVSSLITPETVTWSNISPTATWDVGTRNWKIGTDLNKQFASGDTVIFGNSNLSDQTININAGGTEFEVNGMSVNSATNYTFNGDGLALMTGKNITKNGTGTLAFNNRIKGSIDLNGGALIIGDSSLNKNAHLEGDVTANSGTTVGGHGTIAGNVIASAGTTISRYYGTISGVVTTSGKIDLSNDNEISTLTLGGLNLQSGSSVSLDAMPNGKSDKIAVKKLATATGITDGNINIGSNVTLDIKAGAGQWSPSTSFKFMTAEGVITGSFASIKSNLAFLAAKFNDQTNQNSREFILDLSINIEDAQLSHLVSSTIKSNWSDYNFLTTKPTSIDFTQPNTLSTTVKDYFDTGKGYLNVDVNKTFSIPTIAGSATTISNDNLVAVMVADGKKLKYTPQDTDINNKTGRLFEVLSGGTLIINTEGNSSIEFNGFRANGNGGVILNGGGNVYLGSNATFSNNSSYTGGAIENYGGNVYLGSNATFSNNSSYTGGAIENYGGNVYLGSNATFSNNSSTTGGAIYNTTTTGANANVYLGSNATFSNNSSSYTGGAIYNAGTFNLDTGINGETTLFAGNLSNGQSNSISMSGGILNITGTGTLDMRDPFSSSSSSSRSSSINKLGISTWKLGGESLGGYVDINNILQRLVTLNINEGTLYLYKAGEVDNPNKNDPDAKVGAGSIKDLVAMNLGTATTAAKLMANGGNALSGIALNLYTGSTIGFKVSDDNLTAPVMTWIFDTIATQNNASNPNFTIDVSGNVSKVGQYHLLQSNKPHGLDNSGFNNGVTATNLTYFGFDVATLDRVRNKLALAFKDETVNNVTYSNIYLDTIGAIEAGQATWNNRDATATWDVNNNNWDLVLPNNISSHQFISGDEVVFGDLNLKDQTININAAGSQFELNGMEVDAATNYTFNGDGLTLMAGKSITKNGTGILAFNNRVAGDVTLQGGQLIIGDSSQNKHAYLEGTVTAQSGTTVGGHGTIAGAVNIGNGATLSPGNSIGTITVGELNLQNGARVVLDVLPTGESDKIVVKRLGATSGNVTIGQNVMLNIVAGAGQWSPSTSYSFMTAEGAISGHFAGITSNLAFLTGALNANSTGFNLINTSDSGSSEIVIDFNRNNVAFATFAETYNQRAVANAVEFIPQDHAVYKAIVSMSGEQARLAYDNLSGELYASTENVLFHNVTKLQDGMLSRIHEGTDGLWIKGWGHNSHIKADGNAAKVENKGAGLLLGYDFNLNQNILIGAAVGFEDSKIKIKDHNRKGENKVKSTHFMVYGNADLEVLEVKAGLSYSALRFKANRYINVPTLAGNLHSKYHGHQIHAFIEASKTFNVLENYDVAPYLNLGYTDVKTKNFVEEGSQAALSSKGQSNNRTSLTIGVKNDWYFDTERNLGVTADIGWKHTFGDKTLDKRFNFVNTNTDFKIKSASVNKNSAVIGLGFKGKYQDLTIDVGYQGEFNSKVKDHAFGAKVKWSF